MHRALMMTLLLAASHIASARAELPPGSYDDLRAKAEEAVIIEVHSVKRGTAGGRIDVQAKARVVAVERSRFGLKKGDAITVHYQTLPPGSTIPGPRPTPILKQGETYPAFLNRGKPGFEPAAHGASFAMTPDA